MDIKELKVVGKTIKKRNHPWEYARCKVISDISKPYINGHSKSLNILDIGCGDLFFINRFCKQFSAFNPIATAIDTAFEDEIISSLKKRYPDSPINLYKNFKDIKLKEGYVDIVFLLDVMEHVENDRDFLEFLSRQNYITENSIFFITVPAFNSLLSSHDKWLGHYRRYSQKELKRTIERAGFQYIKGGYFFFTLLITRIIQKCLEILWKQQNKEISGIGNWSGSRIWSILFENVLLCDYYFSKILYLIGIKIPGLSTYILCKPLS